MLKDLLDVIANRRKIKVIEYVNQKDKSIYYGRVKDCKKTININREVIMIDALENEDIVIWVKEVEEDD